ncbi:transcription antitermination factor NusB [Subsaxibacter sp. CAU 1640]|uniref:transcription antitermination factor NusB n=1 Tax=Subsaxibacter sp. CAU 1640 TaxID=2933271 RepID=UPI0020057BC8|nr:transcription antitermination factor NusB [Subsaxibacter sp. CAU 1640]MCK7591617.1 transcription antitermination factor NusB [Subsaxibacter sp. CAU 1640]
MLNRRHIRIKVMQTLYAFDGSESDDFKKEEKFLLQSLEHMYDLYLMQLSLLIEIQKRAEDHQEKIQKKHLATQEEKNPNKKFVNNEILQLLKNNEPLKNELENRKIDFWYLDFEYIEIIYKAILESDLYKEYMSTRTSDVNQDKIFIVDVFSEIIAPNDKLYEYIEDKKLTWIDDLPVINTILQKLLRKVKKSSTDFHFTPKLYKDEEDRDFARDLFKKTLLNRSKFNEEISKKTVNWDSDRIANLDAILLQMAICEFQKFPSIPTKVTINEYLEIAKEYSTPKSSIFINGILDKIVKEYTEEGKLNKIGRGLM